MIMSGQMTRDEALKQLEEPMYDPDLMKSYEALIEKNMGLTHEELEKLIKAPSHQHFEYRTENSTFSYKAYDCARNIRKKLLNKSMSRSRSDRNKKGSQHEVKK